MERDKLPRWQQPCLGSLCWTAGSVSSTPAAGPYHLYPPAGPLPTHSLGRRKSQSFPSLSWKNRETWEMTVWSGRGGVKMNCDERGKKTPKKTVAHLKGASATALVVMVMWSEKSLQVQKKQTETPVWSWRCTIAWRDIRKQTWITVSLSKIVTMI